MEISKITIKEYLLFRKNLYKNDPNFKDNRTGVVQVVCGENRPFRTNSIQMPIGVSDVDKILCACVLIIHKNAPKMLSFAFFEALPNCDSAVATLVEYAQAFGRENGCTQLVVSLDGHINNNVAFPVKNSMPSFGESYCPEYYNAYFESFDKVKFTSFYDNIDEVKRCVTKDLSAFERLNGKISIEYANFSGDFKGTMRRYTDLNNEIFLDHRHYFKREYDEDYDLFSDMRPLLKNKNLIFAKCDGKDVGFVLWYPDFNELVKTGAGACALTFIKYKILKQNPKTAKVVEIGVSAKYRRAGTILQLFNGAVINTSKNTSKILSSWILDENTKSKAITQRYAKKHYKDYFAYEKQL